MNNMSTNKLIIPMEIHNRIFQLRKSEQKEDKSVGKYSNLEIVKRVMYDIVYHYNHQGGTQNKNNGYSKVFKYYSEYLGSKELAEKNIVNAIYNNDYEVAENLLENTLYRIVIKKEYLETLSEIGINLPEKQLALMNNKFKWVGMNYMCEKNVLFSRKQLDIFANKRNKWYLNPFYEDHYVYMNGIQFPVDLIRIKESVK